MPTHRGIKLAIISQVELRVHPEFSHPESTQFTYHSSKERESEVDGTHADLPPESPPPLDSTDSKADRLLGRAPVVSVYIPSIPGVRFWLRYHILEPALDLAPWFYFKMFLNGRHVASWGINPKTKPSGQVVRGLFEPDDKFSYKDGDKYYKNMGTESRGFFFVKDAKTTTVADDGGIIEVKVFRAKGRRRRIPDPATFNVQEGYGIAMVSLGLLDRPEEAKCYDWLLIDPKDRPYATFRFHYRSWDSLIEHQLVPVNQSLKLLPPSTSMFSLYSSFKNLKKGLVDDENDESGDDQSIMETDTPTTMIRSSESQDFDQIFDDSPQHTCSRESSSVFVVPPRGPSIHCSCPMPDLPLSKSSTTALQDHTQTAGSPTAPWKTYSRRPLPDIPVYIPTRGFSLRHSRNSSTTSRTASITASLKSYVDRRASASPEPPEIGVATVGKVVALSPSVTTPIHVKYLPENMLVDTDGNSGEIMVPNQDKTTRIRRRLSKSPRTVTMPRDLIEMKMNDVPENLPLLLLPISGQNRLKITHSHVVTLPPKSVFSMANITIRKNRGYTVSPAKSVYTPVSKRLPTPSFHTPVDDSQTSFDNETTLSLTESQWMCRTPSPVKNGNQVQVDKLWSPGIGSDRRWRVDDAIPPATTERDGGSGLRKKALDWYEQSNSVDTSVLTMADCDEEVFTEQSKKLQIRTWI